MERKDFSGLLLVLPIALLAAGCSSLKTYSISQDRVDQDLRAGNRGYLQGQAPKYDEKKRKTTRAIRVVEIDLGPKQEHPEIVPAPEKIEIPAPAQERYLREEAPLIKRAAPAREPAAVEMKKYTVQKEDTLQKISMKFFGTTKKWQQIYEANRDTLKGPDKLYPGQVINIPLFGQTTEKIK